MTTTVVRAVSSPSFLALVPHLLECTPRRSLAVVPFAEGRSLGAMRVDLPPEGDSALAEGVASTVLGMACEVASTDAIAVAVYTDDQLGPGTPLPGTALVEAVRSRAGICGIRVIDALVVSPDGWASYLDPDPTPHPLQEIQDAAAPGLGSDIGSDQVAAAALPPGDEETSRRIVRLLDDAELALRATRDRRRLSPARRRNAEAVVAALSDPPALFESAVTVPWTEGDLTRLAAMAFCLERPSLRDVALMQWTGDLATGDAVLQAQTAYRAGVPVPEDLARPMWGEGARPQPARLSAGLDVCRRVAAVLPPDRRPGPLAACAWLAWASGRASHAAAYAEQALAIDPQHGLSGIMLELVDSGRLPEWVFERPTSPAGTGSSRGSRAR